jgi:membrane dipeptidase
VKIPLGALRVAVLGAVTLLLARLPVAGAQASEASPPVVDLHVDLSYRMNYAHGTFAEGSGQYVAADLLRAGVAGVVLPLFVPNDVSKIGPRMEDLESSFASLLRVVPETPPFALPGCDVKPGTVRTWLSFEGAAPLAEHPESVATWAARGVRIFGLVHTHDNALATSSAGSGTTGLTDAGRDIARRVHAAGGVLDVSHASDAAADEMIALSIADGVPVVATHSNARALTHHPRNLTDAQIRGIAKSGGVVGVNLHSRFLKTSGRATLADVVRHVAHLVRVGGVDHVALGSDFEGDITPPVGLEGAKDFPKLATALETAGFSREDVTKIFGGNALRILCPANASALKK